MNELELKAIEWVDGNRRQVRFILSRYSHEYEVIFSAEAAIEGLERCLAELKRSIHPSRMTVTKENSFRQLNIDRELQTWIIDLKNTPKPWRFSQCR